MEGRVSTATARKGRHEEARADILQAAANLLAEHGYHGMSMRDLAKATGHSLANLYNYVASKDDLLFALQSRAFERLIASALESSAHAEGPEGRMYAFIHNHVRYVAAHRQVMRVLVESAGALPAGRRRAIRELKERYYAIGREHLRAVLDDAGVAMAETELERAAYCVFGMLNWVYGWYDPLRHGRPEDVAHTIQGFVLPGLVARRPSAKVEHDLDQQAGAGVLHPLRAFPARVAS
jgi:AcrR family transcriptional regulator